MKHDLHLDPFLFHLLDSFGSLFRIGGIHIDEKRLAAGGLNVGLHFPGPRERRLEIQVNTYDVHTSLGQCPAGRRAEPAGGAQNQSPTRESNVTCSHHAPLRFPSRLGRIDKRQYYLGRVDI